LSLGRGFSAPAIFRTPHSRRDRAVLMGRDSDPFNRWEAGQILAADIMLDAHADNADHVTAIGDVLERAMEDPAFAAQMLMPPTESELAARRTPVDPDRLHGARMALVRATAAAHGGRFAELYEATQSEGGHYSPDAQSAGRRALRNACLRYLTAEDDEAAAGLAQAHYRTATNMTDMIVGCA